MISIQLRTSGTFLKHAIQYFYNLNISVYKKYVSIIQKKKQSRDSYSLRFVVSMIKLNEHECRDPMERGEGVYTNPRTNHKLNH